MGVQLFIVTVAEKGYRVLWAGSMCQQQDPSTVTLVPALMAPQASRFLSFAWFSGKSLKWSEQVRQGGVYRSSQLLLGGVGGFLKPRSSKPAWHRHIVGHSSPRTKVAKAAEAQAQPASFSAAV